MRVAVERVAAAIGLPRTATAAEVEAAIEQDDHAARHLARVTASQSGRRGVIKITPPSAQGSKATSDGQPPSSKGRPFFGHA